MRLRAMVRLSSEVIAHYWPMRTFVHHNLLHGLEHLPFEEALRQAGQLLGGRGYLPGEAYRDYLRSGRILPEQIDAVLKHVTLDKKVILGKREVTHFEVLRAQMLRAVLVPDDGTIAALIERSPDRVLLDALAAHLAPALTPPDAQKRIEARLFEEQTLLGRRSTLGAWCDRTLGTEITGQINGELIKWGEAFLDENHAAWPMPGREKGFYPAWKSLAAKEWSPCGIRETRRKVGHLPALPEDAVLESLTILGIPPDRWQDYLTLHLCALPGWTGFIKWRSDQTDYEWQQAYPVDLVQYLAVRLWYERELVSRVCREEMGIEGTFKAILDHMKTQPEAFFFRQERVAGTLPSEYNEWVDRIRYGSASSEAWGVLAERYVRDSGQPRDRRNQQSAAWRLLTLAQALEVDPLDLPETAPEELRVLLDWMDAFPEAEQGRVWLEALEMGYREKLLDRLSANLFSPAEPEQDHPAPESIRPQAQAIFCIDVRSEPLRRHLEAVGDYQTFGFAGFFSVFIRFRALGTHHETDRFPVIMKAKNVVREVPRTYHSELISRHRAGAKLLHAGHELLHDLKENVITPYVMIESIGWFYVLPFVGKTVFTTAYRKLSAWIRRVFVPPVSTALTVDKLSRKDVEEMIASEQRSTIRRALQERFRDRHLNLSLERLEFLRRLALEEIAIDEHPPQGPARSSALSAAEEAAFVEELRSRHGISGRGTFAQMERITRTGFTLSEQVFTIETALRMMGLTRNFARLVLFCAHGSTSENNPFEAALDCGACGGNAGQPNARVLAAIANKAPVREQLAQNGLPIPLDTYFIAGQHNTATDEVELCDLEDLPATHRKDIHRLIEDLKEAGLQTSRERCARFPEIQSVLAPSKAAREASQRSMDWSQVLPEWGASSNAAFVIGRRDLTRRIDLEGRVFLQSYDFREDPADRLLEIAMTGPLVVGQWINMQYYFSTVDNEVYGSGSKVYHNVVGRLGIMSGPKSDLRLGLPQQTVMDGPRPYHEPMRLLSVIEAPRARISQIIGRHMVLQRICDNDWVRLIAFDPEAQLFYAYIPKQGWTPLPGKRPACVIPIR